jgi:selenophosphate synthase
MTNVKIAVRLRRKSSHDLSVFPGLEIVVYDLADKIPRFNFAHVIDLTEFGRGGIVLELLYPRGISRTISRRPIAIISCSQNYAENYLT